MPFTFSHPAIVLPLMKINQKYISTTALVAGSMAPDFEYFIQMRMHQVHGHTISGMLYFDLPLAILMCFLFHYSMRDALLRYFPLRLKDHFTQYHGYDFFTRFKKHWYVIVYSALIGIASHLFWDSFTHANRYFVNLIPFLQESHSIHGYNVMNCEIGQILFSILGGIALLLCTCDFRTLRIRKQNLLMISIYWGLVATILMVVLLLRQVTNLSVLIATSISGGLIGIIGASFLMKWLKLEREILHNEQN
jgi:hypothetical protein